jgi:putative transcription factor
MDHQDWNTVIIHGKYAKTAKPAPTVKQHIKNSSVKNDNNMKKLDEETENFTIQKVSLELKDAISKARTTKRLTQKQLAQAINEKVDVIQSYENGKAIPNNSIIMKMQKILGVKLTGLNKKSV